jgi:hypothetical protein
VAAAQERSVDVELDFADTVMSSHYFTHNKSNKIVRP